MRQAFTIFLSLVIGFAANSQADSIRGKQYQLTGKITGEILLTGPCGNIAFATVIEFEATNLVGLTSKNKSIAIIVTCPRDRDDKDSLQKYKTYQVIFSDTNQAEFDWAITNRDALQKNALSFEPYAISIKEVL